MNFVKLTLINSPSRTTIWFNLDYVIHMSQVMTKTQNTDRYTEILTRRGEGTRVYSVEETPEQILGLTAQVSLAGEVYHEQEVST